MRKESESVLDAARAAAVPGDLITTVIQQPYARTRDMVERLLDDARRATNPKLKERREVQAELLARLHAAIDRTTRARTIEDWVEIARSEVLVFEPRFVTICRLFARDARIAGDRPRASSIFEGLRIRRMLRAGVRSAALLPALDRDQIEREFDSNALLSDPRFHQWLGVFVEALVEEQPTLASQWAQLRDGVVSICRRRTAVARLLSVKADPDGILRLPMPVGPSDAENWFAIDPSVNDVFDEISLRVAHGALTPEAGVLEALGLVDASDSDRKSYWTQYFLEHLARLGAPSVTAAAMELYRSTLQVAASLAVTATKALRFGMLLNVAWPHLPSPKDWLVEAADRLAEFPSLVDADAQPRLLRDLYWTRARLLENAARWVPSLLDHARENYEIGLRLQRLEHEREPRGRALMDLANVLSRLGARGKQVGVNAVAMRRYEEALVLLTNEFPASRVTVLINFACFLMERRVGDVEHSLERALALSNEALALAKERVGDVGGGDCLAAAHLTLGNVLRQQRGLETSTLKLSRQHFLAGLGTASHGSEQQGLIRLNLGQVCVDLFRSTSAPHFLDEAHRNLNEAFDVLREQPLFHALAAFELASLERLFDSSTPDNAARARAALQKLEEYGATRELAFREHALAMVTPEGDPEREVLLERALARYVELEDSEHLVAVARDFADVHVRRGEFARAHALLAEAAERVEVIRGAVPAIDWQLATSDLLGVHAELVWLESKLGAPVEALLHRSCLSKSREFFDATGLTFDHGQATDDDLFLARNLRTEARQVEMQYWRAKADAGPEESAFERLDETRKRVAFLNEQEGILLQRLSIPSAVQLRARLDSFIVGNPDAMVLDVTACRWGTVVLVADAHGLRAVHSSLTTSAVGRVLYGHGDESGWLILRQRWLKASETEKQDALASLATATQQLLNRLDEDLFGTLGAPARDRSLTVIVPGILAGLPLHACAANFDESRSVIYATTVARLPAVQRGKAFPGKVLCVLSDAAEQYELAHSSREIATFANGLAGLGAEVTLCAAVGDQVGQLVFDTRGIALVNVNVIDVRPTREWFAANAGRADVIFYSGHGVPSGLLLTDTDGQPDRLSLEDILAMEYLERRPVVYLSACSTADELGRGQPEMLSFASCLVRIGASLVMAGLWELSDRCGSLVTQAFARHLGDGLPAPEALHLAVHQLRRGAESQNAFYWAPFALVGA